MIQMFIIKCDQSYFIRSNIFVTSDHTSQNSASSKKVVRTDEATMEEIKTMCAMMAANDWRDRQKGIQQLIDMTQYNFSAVANNVVKVGD